MDILVGLVSVKDTQVQSLVNKSAKPTVFNSHQSCISLFLRYSLPDTAFGGLCAVGG